MAALASAWKLSPWWYEVRATVRCGLLTWVRAFRAHYLLIVTKLMTASPP